MAKSTDIRANYHPIMDAAPLSFADAAAAVIRRIRDAIRVILADAPGAPNRAQQVADALGIDLTLAWKLVNVLQTPDLFAAAQSLPGQAGIEIFLRAARRRGTPEANIEELREAVRGFERLIVVHAGDRAALDSMLGHLAQRGSERADLSARRAASKANAAILGVRGRLQTVTYVLSPSRGGADNQITMISGYSEFQRLRNDISWLVGRSRYVDDGRPQFDGGRRPLDPQAAAENDGVPLIRAGHRGPLPKFRRTKWADGTMADELVEGVVGKTAALTFYRAETMAWNAVFDGPGETAGLRLAMRCDAPMDAAVLSVLIHRDLPVIEGPTYLLTSELGGVDLHRTPVERFVPLPQLERPEPFQVGIDGLDLPEDSGFAVTVMWACDQLGLTPADLHGYRLRLRFPPIPCASILEWRLRQRGTSK